MKTYIFHVSLPGTGRVWRKIQIRADQTLEDLHFAIQGAYCWDADHLYSFFMSGKAWDDKIEYCLPEGYAPGGYPIEEMGNGEDKSEKVEDEDFDLQRQAEELETETSEWLDEFIGIDRIQNIRGISEKIEERIRKEMGSFLKRKLSPPRGSSTSGPGDVRKTKIEDLKLEKGKEFMYLFDYGDNHQFKVRVHAIKEGSATADYPAVVQSVGEAPEQYPIWAND